MGRTARAYTGRAALPFVIAICAVGAFLSHPVLGRLWHPPIGSPFAAATSDQFHRVFSSRYPGGSVLAYRVVGTDGFAITETARGLSLWEARVRQGDAARRPSESVVLSEQVPHLSQSAAHAPLSVSELKNPTVLVAYVANPEVWREEGAAVIHWSGGLVSHIVLAGEPRAWILPPPAATAATSKRMSTASQVIPSHPTWRSVELLSRYGAPIVTLTPQGVTWSPRPLSAPTGLYAMPGVSSW